MRAFVKIADAEDRRKVIELAAALGAPSPVEPPPGSVASRDEGDDFVSVARRLGADESKERFEAKLKTIAKAKPKQKQKQ